MLAFIAFHVIVTGGGLMFDQVPQALGQGANDNDAQLVGAVLWAVWCLTLSMGALGMAYLGRAAWKLGRGKLVAVRCAVAREIGKGGFKSEVQHLPTL